MSTIVPSLFRNAARVTTLVPAAVPVLSSTSTQSTIVAFGILPTVLAVYP